MGHLNDEERLLQNQQSRVIIDTGQSISHESSEISGTLLEKQRPDKKKAIRKKLSALNLFRDAVVVERREEAPGELRLPAMPAFNDYASAYRDTGFQFSPSSKERLKILGDGRKKRALSNVLLKRSEEPEPEKLLIQRPVEDALELTDEKLVVRLEEFDEKSDYISARCNLIKNRYYALVPEKEIKKLPKGKILEKLRKLYAEKPEKRDYALIDYYQNLLIIRNCEKELKEKKDKKAPLIEGDTETLPEITEAKEAGLSAIIAWMDRNCRKSSVSKSAFVKRVKSAPKAKQLLMFYLIENGLQAAPTEEYCYSALTDYVPDLNKVKDRVIASKWKFWKRIGSDSSDRVIDWCSLGQAARFALNCEVPSMILRIEGEQKQLEEDNDEDGSAAESSVEEKRDRLMAHLEKKGELILTLYRSAGLLPDMPAEIIEDKKLRERLISLIEEFNTEQEDLASIDKDDVLGLKGELQGKVGTIRKGELPGEKHLSGTLDKIAKHSGTLSTLVDQAQNSDKMLTYGVEDLKFMELGDKGVAALSGITGVLGVLQLIANFKSAADIAAGASKMTTADHISNAVSVTGSVLKNAAGVTSDTNKLVQYFNGASIYSSQTSVIGETTVKSVGESFSTVSGGIQFCSGCVSMLAGTLNMVSAGIEYGRSVSSRRDMKRAKAELDKIPDKEKSRDEKLLKKYLSHEERVITNNNISAGVKAATGFLTFVGGGLAVTGILAPIGGLISIVGSVLGLGYSLSYARKRRNQARRDTVDELLRLDERLAKIREKDRKRDNPKYNDITDDEMKVTLRQEALAEMGYATYKECFIDFCRQSAAMLYQHVFEEKKGTSEQRMYEDALKALGLKIKYPEKEGENPVPGVEMIYSKMMR